MFGGRLDHKALARSLAALEYEQDPPTVLDETPLQLDPFDLRSVQGGHVGFGLALILVFQFRAHFLFPIGFYRDIGLRRTP